MPVAPQAVACYFLEDSSTLSHAFLGFRAEVNGVPDAVVIAQFFHRPESQSARGSVWQYAQAIGPACRSIQNKNFARLAIIAVVHAVETIQNVGTQPMACKVAERLDYRERKTR